MLLLWIFLIFSTTGILCILISTCHVLWRFHTAGINNNNPSTIKSLSVIVPLKGIDAHTRKNLEALIASQFSAPIEFLFAMESETDAAFPLCREIKECHPEYNIKIIISGPSGDRLGKQHNLAMAARIAQYEMIAVMDADILLEPTTLSIGMGHAQRPPVGVAFFYPAYFGQGPWGGSLVAAYNNIYNLHMGSWAFTGKADFIIGGLWFISKPLLQSIGGFEAFTNSVSDDGLIGRAVRGAGHRNLLVPAIVKMPLETHAVKMGLDHIARWVAMLRAEGIIPYTVIFVLWFPVFWSALALCLSLLPVSESPIPLTLTVCIFFLALFSRGFNILLFNTKIFRVALWTRLISSFVLEILFIPLLYGRGYFKYTILWRGKKYRIGRRGLIKAVSHE